MQATNTAGDELRRLERVAHNRSGLWTALAIAVIGQILFVAIFNLFLPDAGANLDGLALITLGLILSVVPALLWLYFFYRMDRLEPEPKHMVVNIFLIGALVTAALYSALVEGLFTVSTWMYNSWWTHLLGGILVVGFIEMFIIYATVRYVMHNHPEFDERVDGVIYAVAAGLGIATVLNFHYVLEHGGVDLDIGSIRIVVNALALASFSGVLGYFIGQARFEKTPVYYLPLGLTIAAVFDGVFHFLIDRTLGGGFTFNPWNDLIFATFVAIVTLAIVFWLISRANEETLRLANRAARRGSGEGMEGLPPELAPAPAATTSAAGPTPTSATPPAARTTSGTETNQEENA